MLLWGNHNANFSQAAMGYSTPDPGGNTWNFEGILHTARGWNNPYLVGYMESHYEERMMYKNLNFGNSSGGYNIRDLNTALKRIEMSAAFFLNMPGPKMIWEFGELGYDNSINRCTNGSINDSCRLTPKPIRWDYLQNIQRKRLYDIFSSLLKLRAHPLYKDVFIANNTTITRSMGGGFKWLTIRSATDSSMLCVVGNFDVTSQTGSFTFPAGGTWYDYLNGNTFTATGSAQTMTLQPGQFHVFLNRNVVNAVVTPVTGINAVGNDLRVRVYANPAGDNSVIELNIPENGNVQLDLWNAPGQKVTTVFSGFLAKGKHRFSLNSVARNLPAGNYLMRVQSKNKSSVTRLIF